MGLTLPPPSSAEVLERVELYFYSPKGPSWPIKRVKPTYLKTVSIVSKIPIHTHTQMQLYEWMINFA